MRIIDQPRTGHFKVRLVKRGPWVAAVIYRPCPWIEPPADGDPNRIHPDDWCTPLDRSRPLEAAIDGQPADPYRVWTSGRPISAAEFVWMSDVSKWARRYAPAAPEANPRLRINLVEQEPIF